MLPDPQFPAGRTRVARCEKGTEELLPAWQLRPGVEALMAFKGFQIQARQGF